MLNNKNMLRTVLNRINIKSINKKNSIHRKVSSMKVKQQVYIKFQKNRFEHVLLFFLF